jgi:hypothetical protein
MAGGPNGQRSSAGGWCEGAWDSLKLLVSERTQSLKRAERAELALALMDAWLSQREAHDWTGVSRDTIRKHQETRR